VSSNKTAHKEHTRRFSSWEISPRLLIILLLVSFIAYFNALFDGFVYDDISQVLRNPWIKDIRYIPNIFTSSVWSFKSAETISNYYRPMMHMIYMFNYYTFGPRPWGFHLVNILFHSGVCVLVFIIISTLLKQSRRKSPTSSLTAGEKYSGVFSVPFIAALLFAVHPVHTEAVTWIAGLPDLSFTFFYLLSFYLYIKYGSEFKTGYLLSVASFFLAALSKEPALTLPIILVAYDYVLRRGEGNLLHYVKRYIPYLAVGTIYYILRIHALGGLAPEVRHPELTGYQYVINVFPLFTKYLEKLLLPVNLNAFYVLHPISSLLGMKGMLSLVVTAVFIVICIISLIKKKGVVFLGLLFVLIPLLPVLYIPVVGENTFTDRYLYLPSFGFVVIAALLAVAAANRMRSTKVIAVALSLVMAVYCIGTIKRNMIWKDDYTLFTDTLRKSPDSYVPHDHLGKVFLDRGLIDKAYEQYSLSLSLNPINPSALNNLGNCLAKKGMIDEAIARYQFALRIKPNNVSSLLNLGLAYQKKGWLDRAIEQFKSVTQIQPDFSDAYVALGMAYEKKWGMDKAAEQYQVALSLDPDDVNAHLNMGRVFFAKGWLDKAIEQFQAAARLQPDLAEAHNNLGSAYSKLGSFNEAVEQFQTAIRLQPDLAEAYNNLGSAYNKLGSLDKAIEQFQTAIKLKPDYADAHINLGQTFSTKGWTDKALEQYQIALKLNPDNEEVHHTLGNALFKKGLTDKAIEQYQIALKLNPDDAEAHYNCGVAFVKKELPDKAIEQFQTAIRLKPDYADAHNNLGGVYGELGRFDKAMEQFQIALNLNPSNPTYRGNLARAQELRNSTKPDKQTTKK
jgi:tetratricopeptide (TPR) repeat protein